jgi:phosphatidyl-myo-inositol dimannoside synthase
MKRSLLLTNDFPPVISGISTAFYHIWKFFPSEKAIILTPRTRGWKTFDALSQVKPRRFFTIRGEGIDKICSFLCMVFWTTYLVLFKGVREIHAGQILSCGPIGYLFQKIFGVQCFLWVYGGETTAVYQRSRWEKCLVKMLLTECRYLVTNSLSVTEEFITSGIPQERIIEILPAVDSEFFSPGESNFLLRDKIGVRDKRVLLTVSRLTMRKGHDLVLRALSLMDKKRDIHYVIVGEGKDRARLENIIGELMLQEMVTFVGRVDDKELPDYYRLCDLYVMPNREVREGTDSVEGFGISFIEAGACEKPVIAGKSGGAAAAVVNGVTGYVIDPENPQELVDKIQFILDNPEIAHVMGKKSRERIVKGFNWHERAQHLARYSLI